MRRDLTGLNTLMPRIGPNILGMNAALRGIFIDNDVFSLTDHFLGDILKHQLQSRCASLVHLASVLLFVLLVLNHLILFDVNDC